MIYAGYVCFVYALWKPICRKRNFQEQLLFMVEMEIEPVKLSAIHLCCVIQSEASNVDRAFTILLC